MNVKIGRNDPCPCGSGKKYKRCCLRQTEAPPADLLWRRLRAIDDEQTHRLFQHAARLYDYEGIEVAWDAYTGGDLDDFDPDSPHNQAFFPWYLYNWRPTVAGADGDLDHLTIAESYLKRYGRRLSDLERRLIELIAGAPFSFHEVVTCDPGQGYRLRDVLLSDEVDVMEQSGSQMCQVGDLVFGRVIQVEHVGLMMGCGSTLMPPGSKTSVIALRSRMREAEVEITRETLHAWAHDIRQLYFTLDEGLHGMPEIRNAEGDPIRLHELYFEIASPEAAFEGLKRLAPGVRKAELLRDGEFDEQGRLQAIEFPWLEGGRGQGRASSRRVLGHLRIEGRRLVASVNSRARAERLREEIERRLGDEVRYQATDIQSLSAMLREGPGTDDDDGDADLLAQPEVQAEVEQVLASHWHSWVEMKLPALEGQSPMEAVQHEDGREMVAALLDDIERREQRHPAGVSQHSSTSSGRVPIWGSKATGHEADGHHDRPRGASVGPWMEEQAMASGAIEVRDDGTLWLMPKRADNPQGVADAVSCFAERLSSSEAAPHYRLSASSVWRGRRLGLSLDKMVETLERHSGQALPAKLRENLTRWSGQIDRLRLEVEADRLILSSPNPLVITAVMSHRTLDPLVTKPLDPIGSNSWQPLIPI